MITYVLWVFVTDNGNRLIQKYITLLYAIPGYQCFLHDYKRQITIYMRQQNHYLTAFPVTITSILQHLQYCNSSDIIHLSTDNTNDSSLDQAIISSSNNTLSNPIINYTSTNTQHISTRSSSPRRYDQYSRRPSNNDQNYNRNRYPPRYNNYDRDLRNGCTSFPYVANNDKKNLRPGNPPPSYRPSYNETRCNACGKTNTEIHRLTKHIHTGNPHTCCFRGSKFMQDKNIREHTEQYNLKFGNLPKSVSIKNMDTQGLPPNRTLPQVNTSNDTDLFEDATTPLHNDIYGEDINHTDEQYDPPTNHPIINNMETYQGDTNDIYNNPMQEETYFPSDNNASTSLPAPISNMSTAQVDKFDNDSSFVDNPDEFFNVNT